ncbi:MAG: class I SAM-dependent methyltransferase [Alphaproteobacteria bacterium]|jgi:ubiquinone/menaquinone biosynthesis C-methylase UbiE|nr:class I SAM-dependent methyltransferase [Alphaproteobacteria bacterium]
MKKEVISKLDIYKIKKPEELLKYYQDWTDNNKYNKDMVDWNYTAPQETVSVLRKYALKKNSRILDAGCGTGLVGIELKKYGYSNIEGVDFSQSMLDLVPQNIYQKIEKIDLNKPLKFKHNIYDVVMCVGTFTYGHVKPHALDEIIRITKNKGLVCFTINEGIYEEYGFDKKIKELTNNKLWNVKEFFKSNYITTKDVEAWLCLAEIIK